METVHPSIRAQLLANNTYIQQLELPLTHATVHYYERGEYIVEEGSQISSFFFILEGRCKIYLTHENGKCSLLNFLEAGAFIGEIELLNESYVSKGVQTATPVYCVAFPLHYYRAHCLQNTAFLRQLAKYLGDKAVAMGFKASMQHAFPLENRLAHFILLAAQEYIYQERHTEVCDYLGVSYRHLLHTFAAFCEKGVLTKEGRHYKITDEPALRKLASVISFPNYTTANR